tara:strand:- start:2311 stop:2940 length:630 start_codon:yes stop_codon:yes gene_type:complete
MSNYQPDNYAELRALTDDRKLLTILAERETAHKCSSATYKQRQIMKKHLTEIRQVAPNKLMALMNTLAVALDDGDIDAVNEVCFGTDGDENMMDVLGDMFMVCNETEVIPAKKMLDNQGDRVDRATILARATDPLNTEWDFCGRCSRPMRSSWIKTHQHDSMICKEIKGGRSATLKTGTRIDSGEHIKHIALSLAGEGSDDEGTECLID